MADDYYDDIEIDVDLTEWEDTPTQADLGPMSWVSRMLRTNERVFRVNICVADAPTKTLQMTEQHLTGLGFSVLRVDAEARVHCFLTAIVRSPDQIHTILKQLRYLVEDMVNPKDLSVTFADVTFLQSGWTTYP